MLGYRKNSFARAHALLQTLRSDLKDLSTLRELQKLLLSEIIRAEKNIRALKSELRAIAEKTDRESGKRSSYLERRIDGFRQCAFIWRCFGDAIAFLYMDKFALKHCFYNTDDVNARHDAGFIDGKEGLASELKMLDIAMKHNVPALLADLTNTVRHGDICLMGGSDPYLLEVKSSSKLDKRGRKQKKSLDKLQTFYEADKAEEFHGAPEVYRRIFQVPECTYVDEINECVTEAMRDRFAVRHPERGLHYLAVVTKDAPPIEEMFSSIKISAPWVFFLNSFKSGREWAPYFPFILTIKDKGNLWNFIRGSLAIIVVVETDTLCELVREAGYEATFNQDDETYPLRIALRDGERGMGISSHLLMRIGMEFVSPKWIVATSMDGMEETFKTAESSG